MSGKDKVNIFPSRMNLTVMKARLKGAQSGHKLLKKKADALSLKFRGIMREIIQKKEKMGDIMKEANFAFAEAKVSHIFIFTERPFSLIIFLNFIL